MGLSALGMVGSLGLFTYEAAVAAAAETSPLQVWTIPFVADGVVVAEYTVVTGSEIGVVLTETQATLLAGMEAGAMATEPIACATMLSSWGVEYFTVDSMIALALLNPPVSPDTYGNIGGWLGGYTPDGGGFQTNPGFPGFPALTRYDHFGGTYGCVEIDGEQECYWYY